MKLFIAPRRPQKEWIRFIKQRSLQNSRSMNDQTEEIMSIFSFAVVSHEIHREMRKTTSG